MSEEKRKSVYTNSGVTSYDRFFSALSYVFVNNAALIECSSIKKEFIGKEPKKGDSVYDHENADNFLINAEEAIAIREAFSFFDIYSDTIGEEDTTLELASGSDKFSKSIKIAAPGAITLNKKKHADFVIKLSKTDDGDVKSVYHIFNSTTITINGESRVAHTGLALFLRFLDSVIETAFNANMHAVRKAGGVGSNTSARAKPSRQVVEEDDGSEEELDAVMSTSKSKKTLDEEFSDD